MIEMGERLADCMYDPAVDRQRHVADTADENVAGSKVRVRDARISVGQDELIEI